MTIKVKVDKKTKKKFLFLKNCITIEELCKLVPDLNDSIIYKWRKVGLPYFKLGGLSLYDADEVLEFMSKNRNSFKDYRRFKNNWGNGGKWQGKKYKKTY